MSDDLTAADLTFGEKARIGVLIARMAKRGAAGDGVDISDLKARVIRIEKQALRRKNGK